MAAEDKAEEAPRKRSANQAGRDQIARVVVVASFLTLFLLVITLIALAKYDATNAKNGIITVAEKVFNAILPVLAGWVGTVLAFYFSSASQEHTNDLLGRAMERAAGRPGDSTLVAEKMITRAKILKLFDLKIRTPGDIRLLELLNTFESPNGMPRTTRLMFLDGDVFKYVIHASTLNAYLVKEATKQTPGSTATTPTISIPPAATLETMLQDKDVVDEISNRVAFVSVNSTLADAKAALDKVSGAQDIIVTTTGKPADPLLGWLTNVDLTKALTVI